MGSLGRLVFVVYMYSMKCEWYIFDIKNSDTCRCRRMK